MNIAIVRSITSFEKNNTRIDKLQNFFKKHNFKLWKSKSIKIKEISLKAYLSIDVNNEQFLIYQSWLDLLMNIKKP